MTTARRPPPRPAAPSNRSGLRPWRWRPSVRTRSSMTSLGELEARIATTASAVVAFSGGVDSSLVAAASARVLGDRALAVTAVSPALATGELDGARAVAGALGIAHRSLTTAELGPER